jgi:hypothetical protein
VRRVRLRPYLNAVLETPQVLAERKTGLDTTVGPPRLVLTADDWIVLRRGPLT